MQRGSSRCRSTPEGLQVARLRALILGHASRTEHEIRTGIQRLDEVLRAQHRQGVRDPSSSQTMVFMEMNMSQ
jgi:hypothetical protein